MGSAGWVPLAKSLMNKGYKVKGSTTSSEKRTKLSQEGFQTYQIQLLETSIDGAIDDLLAHLDVLIINVPPNLRKQPKAIM